MSKNPYRSMGLTEAIARLVFWIGLLTVTLLLFLGCSAVENIGNGATQISQYAQSSEGRFEAIGELSEDQEIKEQAKHGKEEQQGILDTVANIRKELPRVEDKAPSWVEMVERLSLAGILIAIVIIIWQTGIGTLCRKLLYSISFLIPSKSRREAEMDIKALDSENSMTLREVIASKRASDPAYNSAYKKIKEKK